MTQAAPSERRCVVHVGLHKTGTSTIQAWMLTNVQPLADQNIFVDPFFGKQGESLKVNQTYGVVGVRRVGGKPYMPPMIAQMVKDSGEDPERVIDLFVERFRKAVLSCGLGTFVISSENIHAGLPKPEMIERYDIWLSEIFDRVEYVIYLRDQVSRLPSMYSQHLISGGNESWQAYLDRMILQNHFRSCNAWRSCVGKDRVHVRLLERDFLAEGDLQADFASILGADLSRTKPARRQNSSLSRPSMALMRALNNVPPSQTRETIRRRLLAFPRIIRTGPKFKISTADKLRIAKKNADVNELLRAQYFPERSFLFRQSHALLTESDAAQSAGLTGAKQREQ